MDPSEIDMLVRRLVANPHDEEALAYAHHAGSTDPKSYAMLLEKVGNEVKLAPSIGFGLNIFVNQTVALKLDTRFNFYVDNVPQYNEDVPVDGQRLYNVFVASGGVSFFFPNMKRRVFDF